MIIVRSAKILLFLGASFPMGFGSLGTGILFGSFMNSASRNPNEFDRLYGTCLTAFALIETFTFLYIILSTSVAFIF